VNRSNKFDTCSSLPGLRPPGWRLAGFPLYPTVETSPPALGLSTATERDRLSISRPMSAYPLAFPKAFASWSIPPICCLRLAPTQFPESKQRVTSFQITVIESLGRCFLPGFVGVHTGRERKRPPPILCLLAPACSLIWLGSTHDSSDTASLALSIDSCSMGFQMRLPVTTFSPRFTD
jgi:hypothetical protein